MQLVIGDVGDYGKNFGLGMFNKIKDINVKDSLNAFTGSIFK